MPATRLGYVSSPDDRPQWQEAPKAWWEVLGVKADASMHEVESARLAGLERCHPDRGGRTSDAIDINLAWDAFRRERGLVT
jgi:hypothetical protein